jgi:hypothetical protein
MLMVIPGEYQKRFQVVDLAAQQFNVAGTVSRQ